MRVISGFLKGRNIKGINVVGTRPTMDRVKESLFAMIQSEVVESICLDLFAGSGSLGIEAISNGASFVYFVDNNKKAYDVILDNINNLNIKNESKVVLMDYKKALAYFATDNIKFNLILLDPPYNDEILEDILNYIDENDLLYENGQVICELFKKELKEKYGFLTQIQNRKYGEKKLLIYKNSC